MAGKAYKWPESETDLAQTVAEWMANQGWDIYTEVQACGGRADIVGVQGALVWVVECKTTMGLAIMQQGHHWTRYANFSSVAVPAIRDASDWQFAEMVMRGYGIGLITCQKSFPNADVYIQTRLAPKLFRPKWLGNPPLASQYLKQHLNPGMKGWAAPGNADGCYWSPFQETCRNLRLFLKDQPGASLKEAMNGIEHHYRQDATARSCISKWVQAGKVKDVVAVRDGKLYKLYLEADAPAR